MQAPADGGGSTGGWLARVGASMQSVAATTAAATASSSALVAQVGAQAVKVEAENLKTFKNKVDAILQDLDGSPASQSNISQQSLSPYQLGSNFGQATDLANAYNQVHHNLQQLSKTLALQIEAMSMSVDMAAKGYENADEDERQRFQQILNQAGDAATAPLGGQGTTTAAGPGSYASPASYGASAPSTSSSAGTNQGQGY